MMIGLILRARAQSKFSLETHGSLAALYAAEAGLAEAMSKFTALPTWSTNLEGTLPNGESAYSVAFGPAASVNNLTGLGAVNGPRGPGSVAPGTAYVVSVGRAGNNRRVLEAIVSRAGPVTPGYALTGTGQIRLAGKVKVDGVASYSDSTSVPADLLSSLATNAPDLVTWNPVDPLDQASIAGAIKIASPHADAINVGTATVEDGTHTNQAVAPPAPVDIPARIAAKSGSPAPALTPGLTLLASGDYYYDGDLTYTGDLELDGANLYVTGEVDIVGTIKGKGSVFAGKTTRFYGDSEITASNSNQVALYSKGSVELRGFDGTKYLDNVVQSAGNDENGIPYATHWTNAKNLIKGQQQDLESFKATGDTSYFGSPGSAFDRKNDVLGHIGDPDGWAGPGTGGDYAGPLLRMHEMLAGQPPGPTRDFLVRKFTALRDPSDKYKGVFSVHTGPATMQVDLISLLNDGDTQGMTDALNDIWGSAFWSTYPGGDPRPRLLSLVTTAHQQIDYDKLGSAHFNGIIYTNGYVYADNEVAITGALMAVADGTQPPANPDPSNPSLTVNPGDIYLNNGTRLSYVDELVKQSGSTVGTMGIKVWLSR